MLDLEYVINNSNEVKWFSARKYTARTLSLFRARVRQEVMVATEMSKQKREAEVAEMSYAAAHDETEWSKVIELCLCTAHSTLYTAHMHTPAPALSILTA